MKRRNAVRRTSMALSIALVFFAMVFVPSSPLVPTHARTQEPESSATLEETMSWIKGTLKTGGSFLDDSGAVWEIVSIDEVETSGCTLTFKESVTQSTDAKNPINVAVRYQIPLSDLDQLGIDITEAPSKSWVAMILHTSKNESKIKEKIDNRNHPDLNTALKSDKATFRIKDKAIAKRLERAFKHAISLCGGKVDPF